MDASAASLDSEGVLRTDKGFLGAGRFAAATQGEPAGSLERVVRTSNLSGELHETLSAAREQLRETNDACIAARVAGWGSAESPHYRDSIRLDNDYLRAQLDAARAQWDMDQFRLDQARDSSYASSAETARSIVADMRNGVAVTAELKAQAMVAAESDEDVALSYLKTWPGQQSLSASKNHPGRHIFLGHTSDRVRIAAIRNGVAGTSPVQLAEIMVAYPTPEVSAAVRGVLRKNGFEGKAKVEESHIVFGDTYFDASSAHHRFWLSQHKPNQMSGTVGPVYED